MSAFEAEAPRVFSAIQRKAQKEHDCCSCRWKIGTGELYWDLSGIDAEGDAFKLHQHDECAQWYEVLTVFFGYFGASLAWGGEVEALEELAGEAPITSACVEYLHLWRQLLELNDYASEEIPSPGDYIRDAMDGPWHRLHVNDKEVIDCYHRMFDPHPNPVLAS